MWSEYLEAIILNGFCFSLPIVTPTPAKIGKTSITKLDSGLIVVSEDASVTSTVSLTFPSGGSSAEALGESGAAFANKLFAFKSAGGMSSVAILRAVENEGGKPFTCANRYTASVGFTSAPDKSIDLMGAVLSSTSSSFEKWDVREATTLAKKEISIANKNPEVRHDAGSNIDEFFLCRVLILEILRSC